MTNVSRTDFQYFVSKLFNSGHMARFLDLGCGLGRDMKFFKDRLRASSEIKFIGIDKKEKSISVARENYGKEGMGFHAMDAANGLDFTDEEFDAVYSMNVVECISDKERLVREINRVLKPGGQVICCHCDWDSIIYNGDDKELINSVLKKYSNWKQPWMDDLDSWMGRRLWGMFNSTGLFSGDVRIFNIVETEYNEESKGWDMVKEIEAMTAAGVLKRNEYERFASDMKKTAYEGRYLYVRPVFIYSGVKAQS